MIEIIDHHGDCEEMKAIFQEVYARIPPEHQEKIEQACSRVEFCTDFNLPDDREPAHAGFYDGGILVAVDGMTSLSPGEQRGIFAHELGHARDRLDNPITAAKARQPEEKRRAEAAANGYAWRWGFEDDLRTLCGREPTDYMPE